MKVLGDVSADDGDDGSSAVTKFYVNDGKDSGRAEAVS